MSSGDGLTLRVDAPDVVARGAPVAIGLTLTNGAAEPRTVVTAPAPKFEVGVARPDGTPVWRRLWGRTVSSVGQRTTLAPGGTLQFAAVWDQRDGAGDPVPPGAYVVEGWLLTGEPDHPGRPHAARAITITAPGSEGSGAADPTAAPPNEALQPTGRGERSG